MACPLLEETTCKVECPHLLPRPATKPRFSRLLRHPA